MLGVSSMAMICDLPVRFDTYVGCTHQCKYCFASRNDLKRNKKVTLDYSRASLEKWIKGGRNGGTSWIDWPAPLHWGGMSDPFQPVEKHYRASLDALKVLAATKYPFIVSTKGRLVAEEQYLELLAQCNAVVQISMLCEDYDALEPGAPGFEERLKMLAAVSRVARRTIVRCQPYLPELYKKVMANIPRFKEAGAYGVIFESMRFLHKMPGLERIAGDYVFPIPKLINQFTSLRDECHRVGLKFYAGENRLRSMGDSLCCCGVENLEGFRVNTFNANHILLDRSGSSVVETPGMSIKGSGFAALHALLMDPGMASKKDISYKGFVLTELNRNPVKWRKLLTIYKE